MISVVQVQCVEIVLCTGLRTAEELNRAFWMGRGEPEGRTVVDNGFSEAEGKHSNPVLGFFASDGIIVQRPGNTADIGIPVGSMFTTDYLLDHDSHLFVFHHVVGCFQVLLCPAEIGGGPDTPDCIAKLIQSLLVTPAVRDHTGLVYPGKRLEMGILEQ